MDDNLNQAMNGVYGQAASFENEDGTGRYFQYPDFTLSYEGLVEAGKDGAVAKAWHDFRVKDLKSARTEQVSLGVMPKVETDKTFVVGGLYYQISMSPARGLKKGEIMVTKPDVEAGVKDSLYTQPLPMFYGTIRRYLKPWYLGKKPIEMIYPDFSIVFIKDKTAGYHNLVWSKSNFEVTDARHTKQVVSVSVQGGALPGPAKFEVGGKVFRLSIAPYDHEGKRLGEGEMVIEDVPQKLR